jgi:hypothetical protein
VIYFLFIVIDRDGERELLFGEDVRLFTHNYDLYLYYNFEDRKKTFFYSKVFQSEETGMLYIYNKSIHLKFMNQDQLKHEKNWASFEYCPHCNFKNGILDPAVFQRFQAENDNVVAFHHSKHHQHAGDVHYEKNYNTYSNIQNAELYFVYSFQPHIIIKPYIDDPFDPYAQTGEISFATEMIDFDWPWGDLRGGKFFGRSLMLFFLA